MILRGFSLRGLVMKVEAFQFVCGACGAKLRVLHFDSGISVLRCLCGANEPHVVITKKGKKDANP